CPCLLPTPLCPTLLGCSYGDPLVLHSFPTRRSSDLAVLVRGSAALGAAGPRESGRTYADRPGGRHSVAGGWRCAHEPGGRAHRGDRKSTRLNSSHVKISYAVFCLKKKKETERRLTPV